MTSRYTTAFTIGSCGCVAGNRQVQEQHNHTEAEHRPDDTCLGIGHRSPVFRMMNHKVLQKSDFNELAAARTIIRLPAVMSIFHARGPRSTHHAACPSDR
jgi:hypothetical protein